MADQSDGIAAKLHTQARTNRKKWASQYWQDTALQICLVGGGHLKNHAKLCVVGVQHVNQRTQMEYLVEMFGNAVNPVADNFDDQKVAIWTEPRISEVVGPMFKYFETNQDFLDHQVSKAASALIDHPKWPGCIAALVDLKILPDGLWPLRGVSTRRTWRAAGGG